MCRMFLLICARFLIYYNDARKVMMLFRAQRIYYTELCSLMLFILKFKAIGDDCVAQNGDDPFGDDVSVLSLIELLYASLIQDGDVFANDGVRVDDALT